MQLNLPVGLRRSGELVGGVQLSCIFLCAELFQLLTVRAVIACTCHFSNHHPQRLDRLNARFPTTLREALLCPTCLARLYPHRDRTYSRLTILGRGSFQSVLRESISLCVSYLPSGIGDYCFPKPNQPESSQPQRVTKTFYTDSDNGTRG